ncbi:MAG TPA: isoamylase early set domain-containing protein [Syntrophorhabdaceae bacterium]|nr:isoamylase early set domain-containing protein [Syntrophorhabdaceae bacterium]HQM80921.1 isoamylase early set domain-containing protein [Syntrophorhabdaceae bacterium]
MTKKEAKKRVTFKLENPSAQEVFLAGSFNAWSPTAKSLKKDAKGIWKTTMMLSGGSYEYRFVVDGIWQDDPGNPEKSMNEFGSHNSVLNV